MRNKFDKEYLWHIEKQMNSDGKRELISFNNHLPEMGCIDYDHEKFVNSKLGNELIKHLEPFLIFEDEDGIAVKKYEVFNKELFHPEWNKYSLFTPIEINDGRKFPCVIYVHGSRLGGTKIFCEESSGIAAMAAKYRFICALPDNNTPEGVMRLYKILKENPLVDLSKVYLCGFSNGAKCTIDVGLKYPKLFAGLMSISGATAGHTFDDTLAEEAKKYGLPFLAIGGTSEMVNKFPICFDSIKRQDEKQRHLNDESSKPEGKLRGLNYFLKANNLPILDLKKVQNSVINSSHLEVKKIGIIADSYHTEKIMEVNHYIAEFKNKKNITLVKIVAIEGHPHHPSATVYDIAWDFWSQFSRDVDSGELTISIN